MDFTFPDKFHHAARYFDFYTGGDLEATDKFSNEHKLLFYALRQQAEHGPCDTPAPAFWHVTERYKHQAWSKLGALTKFEAMVYFVKHFEEVLTAQQAGGPAEICWMEKIKELPNGEAATDGGSGGSAGGDALPEAEWDDDLRAHAAPTAANIAYLATQVMRARAALTKQSSAADKDTITVGPSHGPHQSQSQQKQQRPHRPHRIYSPAIVRACGAAIGPPVRPEVVASASGAAAAMEPPVRLLVLTPEVEQRPPLPTPRAMAEAAAKQGTPPPPTPTAQAAEAATWAYWFGW